MSKKEFKIGEEFQCGLVKLKCVRQQGCDNCFFNDCCILGIKRTKNIHGECVSENREDKTDVIFVEVEE